MAKRIKKEKVDMINSGIRINKFLSDSGICSRREADKYIAQGKVKINNNIAELGSRVIEGNKVYLNGKEIKRENKFVLLALNKPRGIVCTTDKREPNNIVEFMNYGMRIYPIGRLDKDSEGLILLTNDGDIVNKILRAEFGHEKEYIVRVNKPITNDFLTKMAEGVPILDQVTKPCVIEQIDKYIFKIILTQGLNRQIRRMCEHLDYKVLDLQRIRIMNIELGKLKTGTYRRILDKELNELKELINY